MLRPAERARRKRKAAELKAWLFAQLGRECCECGAREDLTFDHPKGVGYERHRLNHYDRLKAYKRDLEAGNLRVLCVDCNSIDGAFRKSANHLQKEVDEESVPF